jgi:hypothetical protein
MAPRMLNINTIRGMAPRMLNINTIRCMAARMLNINTIRGMAPCMLNRNTIRGQDKAQGHTQPEQEVAVSEARNHYSRIRAATVVRVNIHRNVNTTT